MRRSIVAKVILTAGLIFSAAGPGALSGCKKEEAKPAESGAKPGEAGDSSKPGTAADGDTKRKLSRFQREGLGQKLGLEPITPDEIKPMLPGLKGGTSLGEPIATARGLRVTAMECLTGDQASIKSSLEARLTELGFKAIRMSERQRMNIITVSAEKSPYRLSATVRSGPYPDCPADQKKSKLLMSFFKRPPRPPGAAMPGSSPGGATSSPGQPPAQEKAGAPGTEKPADKAAEKPSGTTTAVPPPEGGSVPAPKNDPTK